MHAIEKTLAKNSGRTEVRTGEIVTAKVDGNRTGSGAEGGVSGFIARFFSASAEITSWSFLLCIHRQKVFLRFSRNSIEAQYPLYM